MEQRGLEKPTSDQVYVFDRLGEDNYRRLLNLIFEKCAIEAELTPAPARGTDFAIQCRRKVNKAFCRLKDKIQILEKEKRDISSLRIGKLDNNEIFTRTLQGMLSDWFNSD